MAQTDNFKFNTTKASDKLNHPKVLLVGYNGANNTGAEAKLLVIIEELRRVLGQEAIFTVPSLNVEYLNRYLQESTNLKITPIKPSTFPIDIYRLSQRKRPYPARRGQHLHGYLGLRAPLVLSASYTVCASDEKTLHRLLR